MLSSPIALCECNIIRRGSGSNLSAYLKQKKKTYHNATKVGQQQVKLGSPSELDSNIRDSNMIVLDWKKELKKWMDCCVYHSIQRQKYKTEQLVLLPLHHLRYVGISKPIEFIQHVDCIPSSEL